MKLQVFLHSSSKFMAAAVMALSLLLGSAAFAVESDSTGNPAAAGDGVAVGMSKRDGITVTGNEAFITRNGVTEKLIKELTLPSGVTARPDGTMILPDKTDATLRATQILTLEGKVVDIPRDPAVNNPPTPQSQAGGVNRQTGATNGAGANGTRSGAPMRERNNSGGGGSADAGGGGGTVDNQLSATFVGSDGRQFTGVINPDGSITTSDGRSVVNDGSLRVLSLDANGNQTPGPLNRNGTVTRADGTTISPDGNVRSSDGRVISTRESRRTGRNADGTTSATGTTNNGNLNSAATDTNNPSAQQSVNGFRVPGGNREGSGNSPNNTGTINTENKRSSTSSPNNAGTLNNTGSNESGSGTATNSPNNGGTTNTGNASPNRGSQENAGTLNNQAAPNATGTQNNGQQQPAGNAPGAAGANGTMNTGGNNNQATGNGAGNQSGARANGNSNRGGGATGGGGAASGAASGGGGIAR